jgi:hypothetical protein
VPNQANSYSERPSAPSTLLPALAGVVVTTTRLASFVRERTLYGLKLDRHTSRASGPAFLAASVRLPTAKSIDDLFFSKEEVVLFVGYVCDHRQEWTTNGMQIGEPVHTVSLQPGESRNLATISWRRRQTNLRTESTSVQERLQNEFSQTRALEEITSAVASEHQWGNSGTEANSAASSGSVVGSVALAGGVAGSLIGSAVPGLGTLAGAVVGSAAGAVAGGLVVAGGSVMGKVESDSKGDRSVVSVIHQRIALNTTQHASASRALFSMISSGDLQSEDAEASATNVTNYNHMHQLNIEYFEILAKYSVRTYLNSVNPILFLPYKVLDFADLDYIREYWDAVREHITDEGLRTQGDLYFGENGVPSGPDLLPSPSEVVASNSKLTGLTIDLYLQATPLLINASLLIRYRGREIPGTKDDDGSNNRKPSEFNWGSSFTFPDIQDPDGIEAVVLGRSFNAPTLGFGKFQYKLRIDQGQVVSGNGLTVAELAGVVVAQTTTFPEDAAGEISIPWRVSLPTTDSSAASSQDLARERVIRNKIVAENAAREAAYAELQRNIVRFESRLQNLVNRRRYFFTRVILEACEPEELRTALERIVIRSDDAGIRLPSIADTTPIGFSDGCILLRLKSGSHGDVASGSSSHVTSSEPWWNRRRRPEVVAGADGRSIHFLSRYFDDVLKHFEGQKAETLTDVCVPTNAIFAEALLGRANGAEYLNLERWFNWTDSPIPNQAPSILPLSTASRFQGMTSEVTVPGSTLQQATPIAFPDTSVGAVLSALSNPALFRDMSKADQLTTTIGHLTDLAGRLAEASSSMTGSAASSALDAASAIGKVAAGLVPTAGASSSGSPRTATELGAALNQTRELEPDLKSAGGDVPALRTDITRKAAGLPEPASNPRMGEPENGLWRPPHGISSIRFWINAFIPDSIPGLTFVVPGGAFEGQGAINGPLPGISDAFLSDNRSFSPLLVEVTSRMHSEVEILIDRSGPSIIQSHNCDFTIEIDAEDGDEEGRAKADNSRMSFHNLRVVSPTVLSLQVRSAANNPLFTGAPDIDFDGTIVVDLTAMSFTFDGRIDEFPAFEGYITRDGSVPVEVFSESPHPGVDPFGLFGGPNRPVGRSVAIPPRP